MKTKKTLRIAGIICFVLAVFNLVELVLDFSYYEFSLYYIITDSLSLALSVLTGIIYLIFTGKDGAVITKYKPLFLVLLFVNIFNNIIVWIVSFWVEMVVSLEAKRRMFAQYGRAQQSGQEEDFTLSSSDYEVVDPESVGEKLKEIEKLKSSGAITDEEYTILRKEILEKWLNKK